MTGVVVYGAKSTQDPRGSVPTQLADCRQMAEREGWTVVGEYSDVAASAFKGDRGPGLVQAREHAARVAAEDGGCVLLAQHSDRFARGDGLQARHLAELWFAVRREGVELRTVQDDSTFTNPLLIMALGERNAEDSRRKGLAVSAGHRRRVADRGLPFRGGRRQFGYRWTDSIENGRKVSNIEIEPAEAAIVRELFTRALNGASAKQLARWCGDEGVMSTVPGKLLNLPPTIGRMLANPIYKGFIAYRGEVFPGEHEAIVDAATFDRVQALRASPHRQTSGGRPPKGRHLLTRGLLKCGECGSPMLPLTRGEHQSYECSKRVNEGTDRCSQKPVRQDTVDLALLGELESRIWDVQEYCQRVAEGEGVRRERDRDALAHSESETAKAEAKLARVRAHYQDAAITADDWSEQRPGLLADVDAAREAEQRLRERIAEREQAPSFGDAEEAWLQLTGRLRAAVRGGVEQAHDLAELRRLLHDIFERIELVRGAGFGRDVLAPSDAMLLERGPSVAAASGDATLFLWVRAAWIAGLYPADIEPGQFEDGVYVIRKAPAPSEMVSNTKNSEISFSSGSSRTRLPTRLR